MPTREEYSEKIRVLLFEQADLLVFRGDQISSINTLADNLGRILEELEKQHLSASQHIIALMESQSSEPWEGDGELAFLLYYLHYPPTELRAEIDSIPQLKLVWDTMAAVAVQSPFNPQSFNALSISLPKNNQVKCNEWGDIYGTGKYEMLDKGWAWTLKNNLMNHLPKWLGKEFGVADFVSRDWSQPVILRGADNQEVRIAIIGDWGSGKYKLSGLSHSGGPACAVMDTLGQLESPPDYIIHLGDTYYSGTGTHRSPVNEESINLTDMLNQYPNIAKPGHCFTLNSNHEMYGGAYGYYKQALSNSLFSSQRGCSYFSLEFGDWIIAGIDSAYFDPSVLYMEGGLGKQSKNPQYEFLKQLENTGKKVIIMSHHTGISTNGNSHSKYLWKDVSSVITPDYWYWGHIHLGAVYSEHAYSKNIKTRCIGHSSMPFAIPPGMSKCQNNVDWYSNTPLNLSFESESIVYSRPRAKNGFAVLTLSKNDITEEVYEIGNTKPVWSG